jgi:hypothetical protein
MFAAVYGLYSANCAARALVQTVASLVESP